MIDNWAQASAILGCVGIIVGAIVKSIASNQKKDQNVFEILLKNQSDQTRILDKLSMLIEHRDSRTEELHRDTHKKLDEVTLNQKDMIQALHGIKQRRET